MFIRNSFFLVLLLSFGTATFAQQDGKSVSLETFIRLALENNPQIRAAERRWYSAQTRGTQVSTLPDPVFSYAHFIENVETRVGPQEGILTLSQKIPFPGKLGLKKKMADQDAVAAMQSYEATKRDVVFQVKAAYYDLYWVDRSLKILNDYLDLLRDFTRVAEQKYVTGEGIQANVLKSQVEVSSVVERKLQFEKTRDGIVARLNALLDRPENQAIPPVAEIDTSRREIDESTLIATALQQREELNSVRAMVGKSEFMQGLARREYFPDFQVKANFINVSQGVSTAPDAGKNAWSVMVGLNLPIWFGKRKAAVREAEELIAANRLTLENLENQVRSEIRDLVSQLEVTEQTLELYERGLLRQAESSLESALSSYRTGRLDFLDLLDAERMLLTFNLGYVKEQASYQKIVAALERAVGGELP